MKDVIKSILLFVGLLIGGVNYLWADETYKLEKVTSVESGGLYVFEQDGYVMNNTVTSSALQTTKSYKTSGLTGKESYVWTLESSGSGYYVKNVKEGKYLANTSSTAISFKNSTTDSSVWSITFEDGVALFSNTSNNNRFLGYTSATNRQYKAYDTSYLSSTPHAVNVYKLVVDISKTETTLILDKTDVELKIPDGTASLAATVYADEKPLETPLLTWTSDDEDVVTVDENGVLSAKSEGSATITVSFAETNDYKASSASCFVTVIDGSKTIVNLTSFTAASTVLLKGNTTTTSVCNDQAQWDASYAYSSSDETVATVDDKGVITAVAKGMATITATLDIPADDAKYVAGSTKSKSIDITVNNPSHDVVFSVNGVENTPASFEEGASITFPADPADVDGKTFVGWAASAIAGTTDEAPSFVAEATMGTEDQTYYAVFATVSTSMEEVTKSYSFESTADSEWQTIDVKRILYADANSGSYCGSIDSNHSYVAFNGKVKVKEFSFAFVRNSTNTSYKVYIETSADNETWTTVKTCKMEDFASDGKTFTTVSQTFDGKSELYVRFHCYNTTAKRYVDDVMIKYMAETSSYSSYCTTVSTTETVTIGEALYATCSSSRALDFSKSGATVYTAFFDGSAVQLAEVKDGVVPANTGVIVHAATAGDYVAEVTTTEETLSSNDLLVSDGTVTGGETVFALANKEQGVGFYQLSASMTLRAGRVYLPISAGESRSFIGFGSETTGLGVALNNNGAMQNDNSIFTLSGQRVMKAGKGLYIQGGKKMVVKQ